MLDVITDFWKPVKRAAQGKPDVDGLQLGSVITFGTVPQAILSNRAFKVSAINTYQFGEDRMTSFVLANDQDEPIASLIVANAEGEQYLAISRRIVFSERMRMFDPAELEAVVEQPEAIRLTCREIDATWKHWVVSSYKKEISAAVGSLFKGAQTGKPTPAGVAIQAFDYMLLTSESNEYAIEAERYTDGRLELYATVYRRVTDIVSVENSYILDRAGAPVLEVVNDAPKEQAAEPKEIEIAEAPPANANDPVTVDASFLASLQVVPVAEAKPPELAAPASPENKTPPAAKAEEKPALVAAPAPAAPTQASKAVPPPAATLSPAVAPSVSAVPVSPQPPMETRVMQPTSSANGVANPAENVLKPKFNGVSGHGIEAENDAIECELRVANKIIEEAIRNEMRLSDVVRRIIALPVSNPDSVHIPITLSDSDYQLLAIRYGMSAADRGAIKGRIIEEMNDFSGGKK